MASALCQMVEESFLPLVPTYEELAKTLLCCFPLAISHLVSAGRSIYQDAQGRHLHLSKRSVVKKEKFLLPLKLMEKKLSGSMVTEMEFASGLNESWIREALADRIKKSNVVFLDLLSRRVISKNTEGWQEFILTQKETESTCQSDRTKAYAKALNNGEIKLKHWGKRVESFLKRTCFISSYVS